MNMLQLFCAKFLVAPGLDAYTEPYIMLIF